MYYSRSQERGFTEMKTVRTIAIVLGAAILFTGCKPHKNMGNKNNNFDLPAYPEIFDYVYDDSCREMSVTVNGRTYVDYGSISDEYKDYSIRECLGHIEHYENRRVYTIAEDPYDNYILVKNIYSYSGDTRFFRAVDTMRQDIYTPEYIEPLGFECWCDSGRHSEQPAATVGLILNADNIKLLSYEYQINGEFAGGGETGYVSGTPYKKGELKKIGITEVELGDKADKNAPFNLSIIFKVTDANDNVYEVNGSYDREMMLGAYLVGLSIEGDATNGFFLKEDI